MQDAQLIELLSSWKTARDRISSGTGRSPLDITSPQSNFLKALSDHSSHLIAVLPPLNMAELEALSELIGSALADRRMREQRGRSGFIRP